MHQTCGNRKQEGALIVRNRQKRFKPKSFRKDKDGQYMSLKRTILQVDVTILNTHKTNMGAY
jgi:hypothetical protein